jgi:hypothetical protein
MVLAAAHIQASYPISHSDAFAAAGAHLFFYRGSHGKVSTGCPIKIKFAITFSESFVKHIDGFKESMKSWRRDGGAVLLMAIRK